MDMKHWPGLRSISRILVVLGLMLSGYLMWRHIVLGGDRVHNGTDICSAIFKMGCDAALKNPLSFQLGLPLAGWGVVYFGMLTAYLLLGHFLKEQFEFEGNFIAFLSSIPAFFISLILAGMMFTGKVPFCPLCAIIHLINIPLPFILKRLTGRPFSDLVQTLKAAGNYLFSGRSSDPLKTRWNIIAILTPGLVAIILYQWVYIETSPLEELPDHRFNPEQIVETFEKTEEQDIPVGREDPLLGPANAPVQLVIFSDFQCSFCRSYAHILHGLLREYPDQLQIIFKHFPLDKACNPIIQEEYHRHACRAAYAAEAANRQGKFWTFHDLLFAGNLHSESSFFDSLAQTAGVNLPRFQADLDAETTRAKVRADIELAIRLNVNATPTLFLNRRLLLENHPQAIQILIEHILRKSP